MSKKGWKMAKFGPFCWQFFSKVNFAWNFLYFVLFLELYCFRGLNSNIERANKCNKTCPTTNSLSEKKMLKFFHSWQFFWKFPFFGLFSTQFIEKNYKTTIISTNILYVLTLLCKLVSKKQKTDQKIIFYGIFFY